MVEEMKELPGFIQKNLEKKLLLVLTNKNNASLENYCSLRKEVAKLYGDEKLKEFDETIRISSFYDILGASRLIITPDKVEI